jgi:hypothetical protein
VHKSLPEISQLDLHWLAGLLEGEGAFQRPPPTKPATPRVSVEMTDPDVLERVARILEAHVAPLTVRNSGVWKPSYIVAVHGERAAQLMRQLRPLMGERRQGQIDAALEVRERSPQQVRRKRNIEIAQRLAGGEKGPALALEYGVTHQNIYYIGKRYRTAV